MSKRTDLAMNDNKSVATSYVQLVSGILERITKDSLDKKYKKEIRTQLSIPDYTKYWEDLCIQADMDAKSFFRKIISNVGAE